MCSKKIFSASPTSGSVDSLTRQIVSIVPISAVYMSIDKGVLDWTEAVTNWDHGNMKILALVRLVRLISTHFKIAGVDICGEYPRSPLETFHRDSRQIIRKNNGRTASLG